MDAFQIDDVVKFYEQEKTVTSESSTDALVLQDKVGDMSERVKSAFAILEQAFDQFPVEQIALSFNGGKDCTVVLHLLRAFCEIYGKTDLAFRRIKYVHFVKDGEFDEIKAFRDEIEAKFGITVELFSSDFKAEVQRLIDEQEIKAILMGNRRTDPWSSELTPICESSPGWP